MITPKDVAHFARLGHVEIEEKERKKLAKDLESILNYVAKLNEANTEEVLSMNGGVDFYNNFREDIIDIELKANEVQEVAHVVRAFPERKDGYLKVPPVLDRG